MFKSCDAIARDREVACYKDFDKCSAGSSDLSPCLSDLDGCRAAPPIAYVSCLCNVAGFPGYNRRTGLCDSGSSGSSPDPCAEAVDGLTGTPYNERGTPSQMECCRENDLEACLRSGADESTCRDQLQSCLRI